MPSKYPFAGNKELGDRAGCRDSADLRRIAFCEVEMTVDAGDDALGLAERRRDRKLGDLARGRDASDLVGVRFGEPERTIGAGHDVSKGRRCRDWKQGDDPVRRDPADAVLDGEPEVSVGTRSYSKTRAARRRQRELRDRPGRRDAPDRATNRFCEPQVSIGSCGDHRRTSVRERPVDGADA